MSEASESYQEHDLTRSLGKKEKAMLFLTSLGIGTYAYKTLNMTPEYIDVPLATTAVIGAYLLLKHLGTDFDDANNPTDEL